jgi:hypothetical protein
MRPAAWQQLYRCEHGIPPRAISAKKTGRLLVKEDAQCWMNGRSERIRTSGPCLPKTVLYQAELHSDRAAAYTTARAPWQEGSGQEVLSKTLEFAYGFGA